MERFFNSPEFTVLYCCMSSSINNLENLAEPKAQCINMDAMESMLTATSLQAQTISLTKMGATLPWRTSDAVDGRSLKVLPSKASDGGGTYLDFSSSAVKMTKKGLFKTSRYYPVDPQCWQPGVITIFTQIVRPSVRPKTLKSSENHCQPGLWASLVDHCFIYGCLPLS